MVGTFAFARSMEGGILADESPDFLHDFRVSLRRMRALIGGFRGVMEPEAASQWATSLRRIMRATARLRDLDVQLEDCARLTLEASVPSGAALPGFQETLRRQRAAELNSVRAFFQSEKYRAAAEPFARISIGELRAGANGQQPVVVVAASEISRHLEKLRKKAAKVARDSRAERMHDARIATKNARYLLAFFQCLFAESTTRTLLGQLARLQSVLGKFNDCEVRRSILKSCLRTLSSSGRTGTARLLLDVATARRRELKRIALRELRKFRKEAMTEIVFPTKAGTIAFPTAA